MAAHAAAMWSPGQEGRFLLEKVCKITFSGLKSANSFAHRLKIELISQRTFFQLRTYTLAQQGPMSKKVKKNMQNMYKNK